MNIKLKTKYLYDVVNTNTGEPLNVEPFYSRVAARSFKKYIKNYNGEKNVAIVQYTPSKIIR